MNNLLKAIDRAYNREPFRIKDIVNSLNDNQMASKEWLLKHLKPEGRVAVLGGWYGYLANELNGISVDLDPGCKEYGKILYPDVDFVVEDAFDYVLRRRIDTIVCTSCEHMTQDNLMFLSNFKHKPLVCLQSNNYFEIKEHINCKESLEEFVSEYNFKEIYYQGELDREKYKRWMVIGR